MPRIVRLGHLNLLDDVVRIKDLGPVLKPPVKEKPVFSDIQGGSGADEAEFDADDMGVPANAPDSAGEDALDAREVKAQRAPAAAAMHTDVIAGAMAEASRIIEDALRKAEDIRGDVLAGVQGEAERIREQAAVEGRQQGLDKVLADVRGAANSLELAVARFEGARAGFEAEYEEQLRWLAAEIAGKVLAKKIDEDDAEMAEMVEKAVQSVHNEPWVRVEVSQEMVRLIDRLQSLYEGRQGVEISAVPAERGTVHIETPSGLTDVSLHTQLANLKEYFATNGG